MSAPARASPRQPRPVAREGMVDITQRGLSLAQPKGGAAAQRRVELSPAPARTRVVRTGATTPAKRGTASKRHRERTSIDAELADAQERIDDALIDVMQGVVRSWGDEAVDGYVCWARPDGFPWWPAQMITLAGVAPKTLQQLVDQYKPEYAKRRTAHVLCLFMGKRPDFAWVSTDRLRHFDLSREECMPSKAHSRFRSVMQALAMADELNSTDASRTATAGGTRNASAEAMPEVAAENTESRHGAKEGAGPEASEPEPQQKGAQGNPAPVPWSRACPDCGRVFTHPPAWKMHVKAVGCDSLQRRELKRRKPTAHPEQQQQQQQQQIDAGDETIQPERKRVVQQREDEGEDNEAETKASAEGAGVGRTDDEKEEVGDDDSSDDASDEQEGDTEGRRISRQRKTVAAFDPVVEAGRPQFLPDQWRLNKAAGKARPSRQQAVVVAEKAANVSDADWLASLDVGSKVQAEDKAVGGWFPAKIAAVSEGGDRLRVHYVGFADRYDVWTDRALGLIRRPQNESTAAASSEAKTVSAAARAETRGAARGSSSSASHASGEPGATIMMQCAVCLATVASTAAKLQSAKLNKTTCQECGKRHRAWLDANDTVDDDEKAEQLLGGESVAEEQRQLRRARQPVAAYDPAEEAARPQVRSECEAGSDRPESASEPESGSGSQEESEEEDTSTMSDPQWLGSLHVGSKIDAKDPGRDGWFPSTIVATNETKVKVHYVGYAQRYDNWIPRDTSFVRRRSKHESIVTDAWGRPFLAKQSAAKLRGNHSQQSEASKALPASLRGAKSEKDLASDFWTIREDVELAELIYEYGTGDWDTKAEHFSTTRTGMSMRGRYQRLQVEAQKEGIDDMVDVRVAMWNTQTQSRLRGNAAPRRFDVSRFLAEHRDYEILDGQDVRRDRELHGSAAAAAAAAADREPRRSNGQGIQEQPVYSRGKSHGSTRKRQELDEDMYRTSWTISEDIELAELVYEYGGGDWDTKAALFSVRRTAQSLRKRYDRLEADAHKAGVEDMTDVRVTMWNTVTQNKLSGHAAPRRFSVRSYLADHPEYEVFEDQDAELQDNEGLEQTAAHVSTVERSDSEGHFWPKEDDQILVQHVAKHGLGNWSLCLAKLTHERSSDACARRYRRNFQSSGSDKSEKVASRYWTIREDVELAELIYEYGTGDWDTKAEHFSTTRTGSSLDGRYQRLQVEAQKEGIDDMVDVRVAMWNTQTQSRLRGNAAPRRFDVSRFLAEHRDYEILDGQDVRRDWELHGSAAAAAAAATVANRQSDPKPTVNQAKESVQVKANHGKRKNVEPPVVRLGLDFGDSSSDEDAEVGEDRDDALSDEEWLASLQPGQEVHASDKNAQGFFPAKIVALDDERVKIHYVGFSQKYDWWAERSTEFVRRWKDLYRAPQSEATLSAADEAVQLHDGRSGWILDGGKLNNGFLRMELSHGEVAKVRPSEIVDGDDVEDDQSDVENTDSELEVEKIVKSRFNKQLDRVEYRVRWRGWSEQDDTWEPFEHLGNSEELVTEFEGRVGSKQSTEKQAAKPWTETEDAELTRLVHQYGNDSWASMAMSTRRSADAMRNRWKNLLKRRQRGAGIADSQPDPSQMSMKGRVRKSVSYYEPLNGPEAQHNQTASIIGNGAVPEQARKKSTAVDKHAARKQRSQQSQVESTFAGTSKHGRKRSVVALYDPVAESSRSQSQRSSRPAQKHKRVRNRQPKGQSTTQAVAEDVWVQCEECNKWRILPSDVSLSSLPESFVCADSHWAKGVADSCDAPEADYGRQQQAGSASAVPAQATGGRRNAEVAHQTSSGLDALLKVIDSPAATS